MIRLHNKLLLLYENACVAYNVFYSQMFIMQEVVIKYQVIVILELVSIMCLVHMLAL